MQNAVVDPRTWQDGFGYVQGWRVDGATGLVFLAGRAPTPDSDADQMIDMEMEEAR